MATAEYQERTLEPEVHSYQEDFKLFLEDEVFPVGDVTSVKVFWKPLREEDRNALSTRYCAEIEHGILSPAAANKKLGYELADMDGAVMMASLTKPNATPTEDPETALRKKALQTIITRGSQPDTKKPN
jgi:hypothetical protein